MSRKDLSFGIIFWFSDSPSFGCAPHGKMYSAWFMCTTSNSIFWLEWYIGREVVIWIVYVSMDVPFAIVKRRRKQVRLEFERSLHDSVVSFVPPRSSNSNHLPSHSLYFFSFLLTYCQHLASPICFFVFLSLRLPIPKSSLWRSYLEHAMLWQVRDAHHPPLSARANL